MSIHSLLSHHKRPQTHKFQIFTLSSLPNSYCTTNRKIVPRENKADKKMRGQNIHRKTLQLKTNRSPDKPLQHFQIQERTRLASTRLASTNPQQMKTILSQKRSQQKDSRRGRASLGRIWVLLPSSGGRGFSPAPALCCAVLSGAGYSCLVSVLPAEVKIHTCAWNTSMIRAVPWPYKPPALLQTRESLTSAKRDEVPGRSVSPFLLLSVAPFLHKGI